MYIWRVYPNARSELFDIDGIRHIIKPQFTAWMANSNVNSDDLFQFDQGVEGIDDIDGGAFGVRQRLQTRRGEGDNRRSVDVFTHDIEVGAFNDAPGNYISNGYTSLTRPEDSISRNYVGSSFLWRVNDRTGLLSRTNFDLSDAKVDIFDVSLAVERSPRFSYMIAYRLIDDTQSDLLGVDMNYRLTEKHTLAVRELFDLDQGDTLDFTVALIRKFPRWFAAVSFAVDEAEDNWGISLSIWPEGLPSATLGSGQFAGMTDMARHNME
jgi:hypothetical protein